MPRHLDRPTVPLVPVLHQHFLSPPGRMHARPEPPIMHRRHSFHHSAPEPRAPRRRHSHHHKRPQPLKRNLFSKWPVKKRDTEFNNESIGRARNPDVRGHRVARLSNEQLRRRELTFHHGRIFDSRGQRFDTRDATEKVPGMPRVSTDQANFIMTGRGRFRVDKHPAVGKKHHSSLQKRGGPVAGAGKITVHNGHLVEVTDESGHYKPNRRMMENVKKQLKKNGINTRRKFTNFFS